MSITIVPTFSECADCGKYEELRPYGKNGSSVCFECAMKDEKEAEKQFSKILDSSSVVTIRADKAFRK